jgi:hypothetical protein
MRPCPYCAKPIKDDVEMCKWCSRAVPPGGTTGTSETQGVVLQARAAHAAGSRLFQGALPLSETTGFAAPLGATSASRHDTEHASVLEMIEAEGWHLNHAAYVFRMLATVSRDRFFASGQKEAVSGEVLGVYLFRREAQSV